MIKEEMAVELMHYEQMLIDQGLGEAEIAQKKREYLAARKVRLALDPEYEEAETQFPDICPEDEYPETELFPE